MTSLAAPADIDVRHVTEGFDCGRASLNDWLTRRALRNHLAGYTNVQVVAGADRRVAGYYGLAASSIIAETMPRAVRSGQAPDPVPALLIGRFAVDAGWQGRGIGAALFADALRRCVQASALIGARAVVVHALDVPAANFYAAHGFIATATEPLTLYQSIERVRKAGR